MRVTLIPSTTSAVTTELNASSVPSVTISATNLATTEQVIPQIDGKAVTDDSGTAKVLSVTVPAIVLNGGVNYTIVKQATAGACEVNYHTPTGGYFY